MRRLLPLLLLPPLVSCNSPDVPVQIVSVVVSADVLAACGEVEWSEPAMLELYRAASRVTLNYVSPGGSAQPVEWGGRRSGVLRRAGRYELLNARRDSFGSLDSTFTCVKTGQTVRASATLNGRGSSAMTVLELNDGQLQAEWRVTLPPA